MEREQRVDKSDGQRIDSRNINVWRDYMTIYTILVLRLRSREGETALLPFASLYGLLRDHRSLWNCGGACQLFALSCGPHHFNSIMAFDEVSPCIRWGGPVLTYEEEEIDEGEYQPGILVFDSVAERYPAEVSAESAFKRRRAESQSKGCTDA